MSQIMDSFNEYELLSIKLDDAEHDLRHLVLPVLVILYPDKGLQHRPEMSDFSASWVREWKPQPTREDFGPGILFRWSSYYMSEKDYDHAFVPQSVLDAADPIAEAEAWYESKNAAIVAAARLAKEKEEYVREATKKAAEEFDSKLAAEVATTGARVLAEVQVALGITPAR